MWILCVNPNISCTFGQVKHTVMKRMILAVIMAITCIVCNAQIAPPKQTDTLVISKVDYNYAEIDRENWPCSVIYKSTTEFRIGRQRFKIKSAEMILGVVLFTVTEIGDGSGKEYELRMGEWEEDEYTVNFSGYSFTCRKKTHEPEEVVPPISCRATITLTGRTVNGTLSRPSCTVNETGKVVVDIWVDNYGNVQKAVAGAEGTTVSDKNLWQAARSAALGVNFNMSEYAPAMQKGTITYHFE